jgi:prepilin-type N-terminal cleavage/methylation domain-containing protein
MRRTRSDAGFTLVELMVVVLIIGILVAIAIPLFNTAVNNAKTKTCYSNLRLMDGIVEQWKAANPNYSITTRWTVCSDTMLSSAGSLIADLSPYVKDWNKAVNCPKGGRYHVTTSAGASGNQGNAQFSCSDHGDAY